MGKLVKRAELTALGTFGIIIFSATHLPAILNSFDDLSSPTPAAYTAAAYVPVDTETPQAVPTNPVPTQTSPVTVTTSTSTPDATATDSTSDTSSDAPTDTSASSETTQDQQDQAVPDTSADTPDSSSDFVSNQ